jgi:flagellar biosynthesis protein FlhG
VVAVASGKGGVGKTNMSVNLCVALAERSVRAVLLDGDLGLANADVLCGLAPGANLSHVLEGARTLEEILIPAPGGFLLAPGASGLTRSLEAGLGRQDEVLRRLEPLDSAAEVIVIDCGAGIGAGVLSLVRAADAAVVVTTPEPTAIADAYALIKRLAQLRAGEPAGACAPASLLVNQARDRGEADATHARISAVCRRFLGFSIPFLGWAPTDRAVKDAVRARVPFLVGAPRSPVSGSVRSTAAALLETLEVKAPKSAPRRGLIDRLFRP